MKKTMRLLSILLGIGGLGMLLLASVVQLNLVLSIGIAMLIVAAVVALVTAFIEGNGGDNFGSYRMPRT
jgi:arginine exporter protein ArgO